MRHWYEELYSQFTCPQYADDSIIYRYCKAKGIKVYADNLTSELSYMPTFSSNNNLTFNATESNVIHH